MEDLNFDFISLHDLQKVGEYNLEACFEVNHEEDPLQLEHDSDSEHATVNKNKTNKAAEEKRLIRSLSIDNFFSKKSTSLKRFPSSNYLQIPKIEYKARQYVSSAEFINKLQNQTPERFHSKPASYVPNFSQSTKPKQTVPFSPNLTTKQRARPVTVLSSKELEDMDIREQKKHQIKAKPLNKKILDGPMKVPVVAKKTPTKIEPFKITMPVKKEVVVPDEDHEFHAQPLPKTTYLKPRPVAKSSLLTQPVGPRFLENHLKNQAKEQEIEQKTKQKEAFKPTRTIPRPFTFMGREEDRRKKNEIKCLESSKQQQEEEKKSREFHARPLPHSKYFNISSTETIHSQRKYEPEPPAPFKARPAEVINKESFVPELPTDHVIHIEEFQLLSDKRAAERKEFHKKLQEKEERLNQKKQQDEERRLLEEEQEKARLRKETEYKAKPIKKYKEVKVVPANRITVPVSPNFSKNSCRNVENITSNIFNQL